MRKKLWVWVVILFIVSIFLNAVGAIWLFWNNTHKYQIKQTIPERSVGTVKKADVVDAKSIKIGDPIDILSLPREIDSWNLSEEGWRWFFTDKGINQPLLYNGHNVSFTHLSPSYKKLGFFFYPEDHSLGEIVLAVLDIDQKVVKEIYSGDNWTSNWEWKGDKAVIVKRSCGTGCMNASVINVSTGEKIEQYRVY